MSTSSETHKSGNRNPLPKQAMKPDDAPADANGVNGAAVAGNTLDFKGAAAGAGTQTTIPWSSVSQCKIITPSHARCNFRIVVLSVHDAPAVIAEAVAAPLLMAAAAAFVISGGMSSSSASPALVTVPGITTGVAAFGAGTVAAGVGTGAAAFLPPPAGFATAGCFPPPARTVDGAALLDAV